MSIQGFLCKSFQTFSAAYHSKHFQSKLAHSFLRLDCFRVEYIFFIALKWPHLQKEWQYLLWIFVIVHSSYWYTSFFEEILTKIFLQLIINNIFRINWLNLFRLDCFAAEYIFLLLWNGLTYKKSANIYYEFSL